MKRSREPQGLDGCTSEIVEVGFIGVTGSSRRERLEQLVGKRLIEILPLCRSGPTGGAWDGFAKCVRERDDVQDNKAEPKNRLSCCQSHFRGAQAAPYRPLGLMIMAGLIPEDVAPQVRKVLGKQTASRDMLSGEKAGIHSFPVASLKLIEKCMPNRAYLLISVPSTMVTCPLFRPLHVFFASYWSTHSSLQHGSLHEAGRPDIKCKLFNL